VRSTIAIDVDAPPDLVFRLAHDVERWPRLLPHYVAVRVLARGDAGSVIARFVARREIVPALGIGLPVAWRSRTSNDPAKLRLRFVHQGGATDGMDVTWRIEPRGAGSRVSIDHDFQPRFSPWATAIERFFVRPIAGQTLATFKAIAEAVATTQGDSIPARPGDVPGIDTMEPSRVEPA
jgi:ribosome-associated toxin RatA of RatAB toxin-antitoxin module